MRNRKERMKVNEAVEPCGTALNLPTYENGSKRVEEKISRKKTFLNIADAIWKER